MTAYEELRRAAQEYVDLFDTFNYPETAAMYPRALKAALAARSEPRGSQWSRSGIGDTMGQQSTSGWGPPLAATPPAEGLDVDDFRFMGRNRQQLVHAVNYHELHHPHEAPEQPE